MRERMKYADKGNQGEQAIESWLIHDRKREVVRPEEHMEDVLPAIVDERGPRLRHKNKLYVMPDRLALASRKKTKQLVEAKCKDVFAFYRNHQCWTTGIDAHFFWDYQKVQEITGISVWVLFLHRFAEPAARDRPYCPSECPTGLFGGSLDHLSKHIDHQVPPDICLNDEYGEVGGYGMYGMVYWKPDVLEQYATLEYLRKNGYLPEGW